jgi:hypothetical protein
MGATRKEELASMYKTWTAAAIDPTLLARDLEAHLNEYADEVISVAYAIGQDHRVLAVYRAIDAASGAVQENAVSVAEQILDHSQA